MPTNTTDVVITADLTALGDASRRDLSLLDGSLRSTGVVHTPHSVTRAKPGGRARNAGGWS